MLTAHPEENAIKSAFTMGAADYMLKPVHAVALCNCVEFMMARIRRFRTEIAISNESTVGKEQWTYAT